VAIPVIIAVGGVAWHVAVSPGIDNFSRIDGATGHGGATVGFGGATPPSATDWLRREGFASVLNLRLANEADVDVDASRNAAEAAGLKYIHLPFDPENPDPDLVDKFLAAVGDESNQPVYIHCNSANRVGALWMISRVLMDGWTMDKARKEAVELGLSDPAAEAFVVNYIKSHRP
jgi:uncharacterized protein (TIGR01244 family)